MKEVQDLTWTRLPDFVVRGEARHEALPLRVPFAAPEDNRGLGDADQ